MVAPETQAQAFAVICLRCNRALRVRSHWIGRDVKCPHCLSRLRVPPPSADGRVPRAERPAMGAREVFNFYCPGCQSLLEAHDGLSGTPAQCPSCGSRLQVPYVDRTNGKPDTAILLERPAVEAVSVTDEPPANVKPALHAYAAAGQDAPKIVSTDDGRRAIECPRCHEWSEIDANSCVSCGTPFTMEGAETVGKVRAGRAALSGLTLGIVGLIAFPVLFPSAGALLLGTMSLLNPEGHAERGRAWAAAICGLIGLCGGVGFWVLRL